jgi:hypothetical protein
MRALIFFASFVAFSPAAFAQSYGGMQDNSRSALGFVSANNESVNRSQLDRGPREECLIRKSDRRRVCHTRAQWRRIAARMEASRR